MTVARVFRQYIVMKVTKNLTEIPPLASRPGRLVAKIHKISVAPFVHALSSSPLRLHRVRLYLWSPFHTLTRPGQSPCIATTTSRRLLLHPALTPSTPRLSMATNPCQITVSTYNNHPSDVLYPIRCNGLLDSPMPHHFTLFRRHPSGPGLVEVNAPSPYLPPNVMPLPIVQSYQHSNHRH